MAATTGAPETAQPGIRWMGRFRRIEHRRDPVYQDTAVSVCGCVITVAAENLRLLRCRECFPPGVAP
ncbi:hypothetical protein [Actinoalloteichus sp. GBA129-24]|uniref:hypothetical protein n=1 Tax=Actinoalloteichus sp. GBA129-24 TaxID=1612551 RepID=UPI0012FA77A4|nr:hypothetical protein [Actinoalloteichus sp. GBA129-24]